MVSSGCNDTHVSRVDHTSSTSRHAALPPYPHRARGCAVLIIGPNRGMSEGHELVTMGHVDMSTLGAWSIWHNGIKKVWGCYLKTQSCDTQKSGILWSAPAVDVKAKYSVARHPRAERSRLYAGLCTFAPQTPPRPWGCRGGTRCGVIRAQNIARTNL